jgi:GxxExxY protein
MDIDDQSQRGDGQKLERGGAGSAEGRGVIKWLNSRSDPVTDAIIACALRVHRALGPGLLESAYAECLAIELSESGLSFQREVPLLVRYREQLVSVRYRLDLIVESSVVVEVKSLERLIPLHRAQLLTYLRLGDYSRGLLINFGALRLVDGIQRVVNGWVAPPGLERQREGAQQPQRGGGQELQRGGAEGAEIRGGLSMGTIEQE